MSTIQKKLFELFQSAKPDSFYEVNPIHPQQMREVGQIRANEVKQVMHYKESTDRETGTVSVIAVMELRDGRYLSLVGQTIPALSEPALTWRVANDYGTLVWYGLHPANRASLGLSE